MLGDNHGDTLAVVGSLAITLKNQGRDEEAEPLYLTVLEAHRRLFGESYPGTIFTLYNLACFEAGRGDPKKSLEWLSQSIAAGFAHADLMAADSDLTPVHGPEFDVLLEKARDNAAAQRAESGTQ